MNDRSGDGTGSFEVKIRTKTAKFTVHKYDDSKIQREQIFGQKKCGVHQR